MVKKLVAPVLLFLAGLATLIGLEVGAFAQTSPTDPDPAGLLGQLISALGAGQYLMVALLGTAILVWLAEHYLPKLVPFLGLPIPSGLLALAMALLVPIIGTAAGDHVTLSTVLGALVAGFTAWGGPTKLISLFTGPEL